MYQNLKDRFFQQSVAECTILERGNTFNSNINLQKTTELENIALYFQKFKITLFINSLKLNFAQRRNS